MTVENLDLLPNTAAFAEDRQGSPDSQLYQSRQVLAFMRSLRRLLRIAYSVETATSAIAVTASPMTFTATDRGAIHIQGGLLTGISFRRGTTTLPVSIGGAGQFVALNPGDQAIVTYTTPPTLTWVPR